MTAFNEFLYAADRAQATEQLMTLHNARTAHHGDDKVYAKVFKELQRGTR